MKRDFASLSAQEALHVAIFIEERNAEIYHQFAEMFAEFRDPESLEIAAARQNEHECRVYLQALEAGLNELVPLLMQVRSEL